MLRMLFNLGLAMAKYQASLTCPTRSKVLTSKEEIHRLCSFCAQLQLTPAHSDLLQPKFGFFGLPPV